MKCYHELIVVVLLAMLLVATRLIIVACRIMKPHEPARIYAAPFTVIPRAVASNTLIPSYLHARPDDLGGSSFQVSG